MTETRSGVACAKPFSALLAGGLLLLMFAALPAPGLAQSDAPAAPRAEHRGR